MIGHRGILVLLAALLGACASYPDVNRERLETLPQHYRQFDVDLAWRVSNLGSQSAVDGVLKSLRFQFMDNIEIWVAVLDVAGKPASRSVSYLIPHEVKIGEVVPFSLRLPVVAEPGSKLRFTYKYTASDGGDSRGEDRMQSFDIVVPAR